MENKPIVSVCMITYAHGPFIATAIESVLMQKTNFPFELVIGEDDGPDNTRAICEVYAQEYPDIIRLLPYEKNMGNHPNFIRTLYNCTGKYIALLEGDDYWTDPNKLQKQVDLMATDQSLAFTFHNVHILQNNNVSGQVYPGERQHVVTIKETLNHDYFQTCSVLFRSDLLFSIPRAEAKKWIYNDITLYCMLLREKGLRAQYIPEVMGTYRIHPGGVWSMANIQKKYNHSQKAEVMLLDLYYHEPELRPLLAKREMHYYNLFMIETAKVLDWKLMNTCMRQYAYWSMRAAPLKVWRTALPFAYYVRALVFKKAPKKTMSVTYGEKPKKRKGVLS
jgi:glycosyltransferase involved in cell wall biosynthesis